MKKIVKIISFVIALCLLSLGAFAQQNGVTVTLDGALVDCASYGQEAVIAEGRTLVPLRAIFEALGATVEWNQQTKTVTSVLDETEIKLTIGEKALYKNGEEILLDVPARVMNNRTLVPVRAVSEAFGAEVEWDSKTRTVILKTDPYKRGINDGRVYESQWMGIQYAVPYGFTYASEGELRRIMGIAEGSMNTEIDFSRIATSYEFVAMGVDGSNLQLVTEKNTDEITVEKYLEQAHKAYKDNGIEYDSGDVYSVNLCGVEFKAQDFAFSINGAVFRQSIAVFEKDERFVTLMFSYTDSDSLGIMLDGFYAYETYVPDWKRKDSPEIYDNLRFGMSEKQAKKVLSGEISEYVNVIAVRDIEGIYDNEDEKITGDINIDFMSLEFENDALYNVYVTTEYTTKEEAQKAKISAEEFYKTLPDAYEWGNPNFSAEVKSTKIDGQTLYYCAIEMRENQIYLIGGNNGDVVFRNERNEKAVPAEIADTHAYGEFYLGMSKSEILDKAKGEAEFIETSESFFVNDRENKFDDEDKRITDDVNVETILFDLNNDVLHTIEITTSKVSSYTAEQIKKTAIRYFGSDYEYIEYTDSYRWKDRDGKQVELMAFSDKETGMFEIRIVISNSKYLS